MYIGRVDFALARPFRTIPRGCIALSAEVKVSAFLANHHRNAMDRLQHGLVAPAPHRNGADDFVTASQEMFARGFDIGYRNADARTRVGIRSAPR